MKKFCSIDEVIKILNRSIESDQIAITKLMSYRVLCNDKLADDESIQCLNDDRGGCSIGCLGLINGLFGIDDNGHGPITAVYDNNLLIRFEKTNSQ